MIPPDSANEEVEIASDRPVWPSDDAIEAAWEADRDWCDTGCDLCQANYAQGAHRGYTTARAEFSAKYLAIAEIEAESAAKDARIADLELAARAAITAWEQWEGCDGWFFPPSVDDAIEALEAALGAAQEPEGE